MIDVNGRSINTVNFNAINIRNHGRMEAHNGREQRILNGTSLRVYPGGELKSGNLQVNVATLIVDVMGTITADGLGFRNQGQYIVVV